MSTSHHIGVCSAKSPVHHLCPSVVNKRLLNILAAKCAKKGINGTQIYADLVRRSLGEGE